MSEGHFKIAKVGDNIRSWDSQKGGPMLSYYVTVEGDERSFELAQKKETSPPVVGQDLHARIESREHDGKTYYSLKKVFQSGGFGGGGFRPEDPERQRKIVRQHSQHMAIETLKLAQTLDIPLPVLSSVHGLVTAVEQVADRFDRDVESKTAPSQSPASGMKVEEGRGNGSAGASSAPGASVPVSVPDPGQ